MTENHPEVRLRVLTAEDAPWLVALDRAGEAGVRPLQWEEGKLTAELEEGIWASDEQVGWAVIVDGAPGGVALARNLTGGDGVLDVRLSESARIQATGREVLRQLADHHLSDHPALRRLEGRTHQRNVPMQRAFNAAGFRLEARYRDAIEEADGTLSAEWGYALTRADWEACRHRSDDNGYDVHGLVFVLEGTLEDRQDLARGSASRFLQDGRRVTARYSGGRVSEGEAAGILVGDSLRYRFVHRYRDHELISGSGQARLQRRGDERLELIDEFEIDHGVGGRNVWVERR